LPLLNIRRFTGSEFRRNTFTLITGTAAAQAIPIAAAPLLARLFSPTDFGILALFTGVVTVASVFGTLRYSQAILIPTDETDVIDLVVMCSWLSGIFALIIAIAMIPFEPRLAAWFGLDRLDWWIVLVPIAVLLTSLTTTFYLLCNWRRQYSTMANSRVVQWAVTTALQLAMGYWLGANALVLIAAGLVGQAAGFLVLLRQANTGTMRWRSPSIRALAIRFRDFPLFSLPADLIGNLSNQAPVFLLNSFFGTGVVGLFNITTRLLTAPITLLATSINQVAQERAAKHFAEHRECHVIYVRTLRLLLSLAVIPSLLLFALAPMLFEFALGREWREAGIYAQIMVPLFFLRFAASPLSFMFYIAEKQGTDLVWQIALLIVTVGTISAGGAANDPKLAMGLYSAGYSLMYLIYLVLSYRLARGKQIRPQPHYQQSV
jgi:O-antigen/teichoic acid export membrane protein